MPGSSHFDIDWRGDGIVKRMRGAVEDATAETLERAAQRARDLAPVRTGALRDSIRVLAMSGNGGTFGSTSPYAFFVEIGARGQAPHPMLRAAADEEFPELAQRIKDEF